MKYMNSPTSGTPSSGTSASKLKQFLTRKKTVKPVKPPSKIKLAKRYIFRRNQREAMLTQGITSVLPPHYKTLESEIHKLILSLSPYIPSLRRRNNSKTNEDYGKEFIKGLLDLLVAIYSVKVPAGEQSPYWRGVMSGLREYNYKPVKNAAFTKLASQIGLPNTNKVVLQNIYEILSKSDRSASSGKQLGKNLAHILKHYRGRGNTQTPGTPGTPSAPSQRNYYKGIALGLRPLGLEVIGEQNPRMADIARFATQNQFVKHLDTHCVA